ncbi:MAG: hypothetical protein O9284_09890 [Steroidobacteraceae bacterium]|jgi:hypothetical protein|nr:hypothetical protein [Steroidobacteraceae bacterium]
MNSTILINAASAPTAAPTNSTEGTLIRDENRPDSGGKDELVTQVTLTGTGTVRLFGRLHRNLPWQQMGADITASGVVVLPRVPFLFAQVVAVSGGSATVAAAF